MQRNKDSLSLNFVVLLAIGFLALGCDGGPASFDVTGTVTFQGEPVEQGTVNFRSEEGKLFGGGLQAGGEFEFRLPPGEFAVRIDAPASIPSDWKEGQPIPTNLPRLLPMKFANFRSSGLQAAITAEPSSHTINFELE